MTAATLDLAPPDVTAATLDPTPPEAADTAEVPDAPVAPAWTVVGCECVGINLPGGGHRVTITLERSGTDALDARAERVGRLIEEAVSTYIAGTEEYARRASLDRQHEAAVRKARLAGLRVRELEARRERLEAEAPEGMAALLVAIDDELPAARDEQQACEREAKALAPLCFDANKAVVVLAEVAAKEAGKQAVAALEASRAEARTVARAAALDALAVPLDALARLERTTAGLLRADTARDYFLDQVTPALTLARLQSGKAPAVEDMGAASEDALASADAPAVSADALAAPEAKATKGRKK